MTEKELKDLIKELKDLIAESEACYAAMSPVEQQATSETQRQDYIKAEASWPRPKFKVVNGIKVYTSYADYCNG